MKSSVGFRFSVISACAVVAGCRFSIEWKTVARKRSGGFLLGHFPKVYGEARYLSNPPDRTARNNYSKTRKYLHTRR